MAPCDLWSLSPSRARQRTAQPRRWAPWGPLPQGAGHLVLRASGLALLTLFRGVGGCLSQTPPSFIGHGLKPLAFSLLIHQPYQGWAGLYPICPVSPWP